MNNVSLLSTFADADRSGGFLFYWDDETGEPWNFHLLTQKYGAALSPDKYEIQPLGRHKKPPKAIVERARLILETNGKQPDASASSTGIDA